MPGRPRYWCWISSFCFVFQQGHLTGCMLKVMNLAAVTSPMVHLRPAARKQVPQDIEQCPIPHRMPLDRTGWKGGSPVRRNRWGVSPGRIQREMLHAPTQPGTGARASRSADHASPPTRTAPKSVSARICFSSMADLRRRYSTLLGGASV